MSESIKLLQPQAVWEYFYAITQIPRPSKKEEKIIAYLLEFGKKYKLETQKDETGNVLIRKNASKGFEDFPTVVLQSHMDMVCEKNNDVDHDFEKDPIRTYIEEGWVKAMGTTLGADDGIGVATQLAILAADDIEHGPLECLFTMDEESGLSGAFGLKPDLLKGKILLNLDSEDEGELFIGCAGGRDTNVSFDLSWEAVPKDYIGYKIDINGLQGGHSGDDIHKGFGNANKILNRIVYLGAEKYGLRISLLDGGNLRNAIAREAFAEVVIPKDSEADFKAMFDQMATDIKLELHKTEPNLNFDLNEIEPSSKVWSLELQNRVLNALYACPHGVIAWSQDIPNFVETSTNLAAVKTLKDRIEITTSQRSSSESEMEDVVAMVASAFKLAGAQIEHSVGYPGWKPNPNSKIMEITSLTYEKLFDKKPKVLAVHAGLECGLIGKTYPKMDMISYGPTIKGAHSPDERIEIKTVQMFWDLTLDILKSV
ncbi:MAG: aminoacyl-histidine dipeptidase [Bacteroidales bacterium]|nr:aminoacyl-histidine dipeptidase [Bacteroidales bacterium]